MAGVQDGDGATLVVRLWRAPKEATWTQPGFRGEDMDPEVAPEVRDMESGVTAQVE